MNRLVPGTGPAFCRGLYHNPRQSVLRSKAIAQNTRFRQAFRNDPFLEQLILNWWRRLSTIRPPFPGVVVRATPNPFVDQRDRLREKPPASNLALGVLGRAVRSLERAGGFGDLFGG